MKEQQKETNSVIMTSIGRALGHMVDYAFNTLDMSSAAGDVVVVRQPDGSLRSTPFVVRFGRVKVLRPQDKIVTIDVNGTVTQATMKMGADGNAFWVEPLVPPIFSVVTTRSHPGSHDGSLLEGDTTLGGGGHSGQLTRNKHPGTAAPQPSVPAGSGACTVSPIASPVLMSPVLGTSLDAAGHGPPTLQLPVPQQPPSFQDPSSMTRAAMQTLSPSSGQRTAAAATSVSAVGVAQQKSPKLSLGHFPPQPLTTDEDGEVVRRNPKKYEQLLASFAAEQSVGGATGDPPAAAQPLAAATAPHTSGPQLRLSRFASNENLQEALALEGLTVDQLPCGDDDDDDDETDPAVAGDSSVETSRRNSMGPPALPAAAALPASTTGSHSSQYLSAPSASSTVTTTGRTPPKVAPPSAGSTIGALANSTGQAIATTFGFSQEASFQMDNETSSSDDDDDVYAVCDDPPVMVPGPNGEMIARPPSATSDRSTSSGGGAKSPAVIYQKTLLPSSLELEKLNLRDGCNAVKFQVGTSLRGRVEVSCRVYLWPCDAVLAISDIDGTITKSDVIGHIAAYFGKDWTHEGLCSLYSKVAENGYRFVYLTARSVTQTEATRKFLENVVQDGNKRLPDGPVFTAPDKIYQALKQELAKKSFEFKISCLSKLRDAFPRPTRPLYAGFGNRLGDVVAYQATGIAPHKIFIINKDSVVHVCSVKRTYRDLTHLVDVTFPALPHGGTATSFMASAAALLSATSPPPPNAASNSGGVSGTPTAGAATLAASPVGSSSTSASGAAAPATTSSVGLGRSGSHTIAATNQPAVDVDFNSFNYWRVDPASLLMPPSSNSAPSTAPAGAATSAAVSRVSPSGMRPTATSPGHGVTGGNAPALSPTTTAPSAADTGGPPKAATSSWWGWPTRRVAAAPPAVADQPPSSAANTPSATTTTTK